MSPCSTNWNTYLAVTFGFTHADLLTQDSWKLIMYEWCEAKNSCSWYLNAIINKPLKRGWGNLVDHKAYGMPAISLILHTKNHRTVQSIPPVPMPFPGSIILFRVRHSMAAVYASVYSHAIVRGRSKFPIYNSSLRAFISTLIWPSRFCCFSYLLYISLHVMSATLYLFPISVRIPNDLRYL